MDFSKNTVLKENYTFFVGNENGFALEGEHGLYNRDTRFISKYAWTFPQNTQTLLSHNPRPDKLELHHCDFDTHYQRFAIQRNMHVEARLLKDEFRLENTSMETQVLELRLSLESDFVDLFEARGWHQLNRKIVRKHDDRTILFSYQAQDGFTQGVKLLFSQSFTVSEDELIFQITLDSKEVLEFSVLIQVDNPLESGDHKTISYEVWEEMFSIEVHNDKQQDVLKRAIEDLRALLLFDESGTFAAAGIPWFVTAFGRDSLLTALMMLPYGLNVAKGTLNYLAKHQATDFDSFRNAQPGKILHEVRYGELSRLGKTPHSSYYGTVDATPLFMILLHEVYKQNNDLAYLKSMQPHWEAALNWMIEFGDLDSDGFLEFKGPEKGEGLSIQSWKDSGDSMSHADGSLAEGAIAVSEVQGYAYSAYLAAADFYDALGQKEKASEWCHRASDLKQKFHEVFWLEEMQTYAMALDGSKKPLKVHNSDAGQLLWAGIVPEEIAPKLIATLLGEDMWTGWGIRTLGKNEKRYNPLSYHNGSVWPHDTALTAKGMEKYGFKTEANQIAEALFDLAATQQDLRLAELISGYKREEAPPIPYPSACRPQAWDAAALVFLSEIL